MFVIKYDKVSMIRLVQCIEKYPAIYDNKNHYSKEEQDAAWDKVALAVGEKDSLCRDRWHSIKSCYIRHLKYTALNTKRKPYYLAEFLDFLLPHVSDRIRAFLASKSCESKNCLPSYLKEALPKDPASVFKAKISNDQNIVIKEEIVDVEEVSDTEWLSVTPDFISQPSSSKSVTKRLPANHVTNTRSPKKIKTLKVEEPFSRSSKKIKTLKVEEPFARSSKKKKTLKIEDPCKPKEDDDVTFFKSLLPEIKRMSSHQKLKFKQEALSIIEDILYASEEVEVEDLNIMD